ncbi:sulfur carrier protein ThiS [Vibrio gangliei]|uniref:sulfur carrier protein ThiS n=1 Tax=Vibrio gangliei TaxID=2077090 RepID=UPI000D01B693|nr:sulfur carrier protein ThiS [Vibrio gangliei]
MQVRVNQQVKTLNNEQNNLGTFLTNLDIDTKQVAVAVNSDIIPKSSWSAFELKEGDDIAIFSMIAGG